MQRPAFWTYSCLEGHKMKYTYSITRIFLFLHIFVKHNLHFGFGLIYVLWPFNTFLVISGAVNYPNHTVPGQASKAVYRYLVHILSPVTDKCSSWISGRRRMAVEMVSWPSLHERICMTWGLNSGPLACQADALPIELPRPAEFTFVTIWI